MTKNLFILFIFISLGSFAQAQLDRSKVPTPGPEPEFDLGKFNEFTLDNGLKVIVVENHKIARVAYQFRLDRAPFKENEKAGLARMAGNLLSAGTEKRTKDALDEEVGFLGASLFTSSTSVYCAGLSRHKNQLADILQDVVLHPVFPAEELDKLKNQTLSGIEAGKEDPSSISSNVTSVVFYGSDHAYGEIETSESIESITVADCKDYYSRFFTPRAGYLIIVGDITVSEAKAMATSKFGSWEGHKLVKGKIDIPNRPAQTQVSFAHKSGAVQSVISVGYPLENKPGNKDEVAVQVMNAILGGASFGARLMQNLREDKAYTYGCRSSLSNSPYVARFSAGASVRNEVTDSAITEILGEMQRLATEMATEEELNRVKSSLKGAFSRRLEDPQTIASYALSTSLYKLPADHYSTYLKRVEAITLADVKRVASTYLTPDKAHIIVVGDGVNVASTLEKFGKVTFYDAFGKPTTAPGFKLDPDLTVAKILNNAIKAFGGAEKMEKVKSFEVKMEATTQMGVLKLRKAAIPKKKQYYQGMYAGGMTVSEVIMSKDKFNSSSPQGEVELDEETKKGLLKELYVHEELFLKKDLSGIKLLGGEIFNGEKVAVIEVTEGEKSSKRFYSIATSLLLGVSTTNQGQEMVWKFSDYKAHDGIMFPSSSSNSLMKMDFVTKSVTINGKVDKKLFKF